MAFRVHTFFVYTIPRVQFVSTVWKSSLHSWPLTFFKISKRRLCLNFGWFRMRLCRRGVHIIFLTLLLGSSGAAAIRLANLRCFQIVLSKSKSIKFHSWETDPLKISVAAGTLRTFRARVRRTYRTISIAMSNLECLWISQSQVWTQTLHEILRLFSHVLSQDQAFSHQIYGYRRLQVMIPEPMTFCFLMENCMLLAWPTFHD